MPISSILGQPDFTEKLSNEWSTMSWTIPLSTRTKLSNSLYKSYQEHTIIATKQHTKLLDSKYKTTIKCLKYISLKPIGDDSTSNSYFCFPEKWHKTRPQSKAFRFDIQQRKHYWENIPAKWMALLACLCRLLFKLVDAKIVFGGLSWKQQIVPDYREASCLRTKTAFFLDWSTYVHV